MIVGKGLLAQAFTPHFGTSPDIVIFASGVSNSLESRLEEFERERALLLHSLSRGGGRFVYFSSCGVTAAESELSLYMRHKRSMESLVLGTPGGLVLRLPQVVGRTDNPHTLTNFLRNHIVSGEHFTVWAQAERNLVDIDDVVKIGVRLTNEPPIGVTAISIAAARSSPMPHIVKIFERVLGRSANCSFVQKGAPMVIDTALVESLSAKLSIDLGDGYIDRVIERYYAPSLYGGAGDATTDSNAWTTSS